MDAVKRAGITNISIVTQPLESNAGTRTRRLADAQVPFADKLSASANSQELKLTTISNPTRTPRHQRTTRSAADWPARLLLHAASRRCSSAGPGISHSGQNWGDASATAGAIQATMVSALPLPPKAPTDQDNVLATENPIARARPARTQNRRSPRARRHPHPGQTHQARQSSPTRPRLRRRCIRSPPSLSPTKLQPARPPPASP